MTVVASYGMVLCGNSSDELNQRYRGRIEKIFCSLPVPSQHLLVLLFGTFRMVADSSESYGTKMNPDAIAISVAPSLFHSCIHDGRQVKVEDVQRFKLASEVVRNIITSFGHTNLFPRECYEFYARITGRTLRVDENWLFTFQYPSRGRQAVTIGDVDVEGEGISDCDKFNEPSTLRTSFPHRLSSSVGEHSLDSPDTPLLPAQRVSNNKVMYSRPLAHSVGGETWLMEVISDDVCKKKRSLKKKH
ncbi:hypothetical protein Q1695_012685 [Nippostrongylus brasiliensis]|nr:hypothetical protein Q1695_012685 [Nippostrongylus brasiliensis]